MAKTVALRLKYGARTAFAETAARPVAWLAPYDADLLVPVPLHRWRLWSHGYNQAALIASALAKARGVAQDADALVRSKPTPVLRGLGPRARAKAVSGAFTLRGEVRGKHVVLVDDVYTPGATADACVPALLRGKAAKVTVLTWARVIDVDGDD